MMLDITAGHESGLSPLRARLSHNSHIVRLDPTSRRAGGMSCYPVA
jgi:hypothetical protein